MRPAPAGVCLGVGLDLVDPSHFARFLRRNQSSLGEIFTARELAAAESRGLYLASRWALKEAVLKALGTGWGGGVQWTEVEALGALTDPQISLHGRARELAEETGGASVTGSVGYARECLLAIAMLHAAESSPGRNGEILPA